MIVSQKKQEMTFEQAVSRLEQIADILAKGDSDLDDAVALYEEGVKLSEFCNKKLSKIQQKITVIKEEDRASAGESDD